MTAHGVEDRVESVLQSLIDDRGPILFHDAGALERSLLDRCPRSAPDIALLRIALDEQVPQALLSVDGDEDRKLLAARLEKRLRERRGINAYAAKWAVEAWANVFEFGVGALATVRPDQSVHQVPTEMPATVGRSSANADTSDRPHSIAPPMPRTEVPVARAVPQGKPVRGARWRLGGLAAGLAIVAIATIAVTAWQRSVDLSRPPLVAAAAPSDESKAASSDGMPRDPAIDHRPLERSNEEVTPIATTGAHGESERVVLEPSQPIPPALASGCTRSTCGSVVAIREVHAAAEAGSADDARLRSQISTALGIAVSSPASAMRSRHDVVALMDDRSVLTVRQSSRPSIGSRVRWADGRLATIQGESRPRIDGDGKPAGDRRASAGP